MKKLDDMKAHVMAAVADNHAGIQLALKEFCEKYPSIFRIRWFKHLTMALCKHCFSIQMCFSLTAIAYGGLVQVAPFDQCL